MITLTTRASQLITITVVIIARLGCLVGVRRGGGRVVVVLLDGGSSVVEGGRRKAVNGGVLIRVDVRGVMVIGGLWGVVVGRGRGLRGCVARSWSGRSHVVVVVVVVGGVVAVVMMKAMRSGRGRVVVVMGRVMVVVVVTILLMMMMNVTVTVHMLLAVRITCPEKQT